MKHNIKIMLTAMVFIIILSQGVYARGWTGNSSQLWTQQNPTWMNQQNLQNLQNVKEVDYEMLLKNAKALN